MKGLYELAESVHEQTGYPCSTRVVNSGSNIYNIEYRIFDEAADQCWMGKLMFHDLKSKVSLHDRMLTKIVDAIERSLTCETMKGMVIAWQ